jgi:hypothetical protein
LERGRAEAQDHIAEAQDHTDAAEAAELERVPADAAREQDEPRAAWNPAPAL